jgi:hypothetical protein
VIQLLTKHAQRTRSFEKALGLQNRASMSPNFFLRSRICNDVCEAATEGGQLEKMNDQLILTSMNHRPFCLAQGKPVKTKNVTRADLGQSRCIRSSQYQFASPLCPLTTAISQRLEFTKGRGFPACFSWRDAAEPVSADTCIHHG